jgi:hypothetical protein
MSTRSDALSHFERSHAAPVDARRAVRRLAIILAIIAAAYAVMIVLSTGLAYGSGSSAAAAGTSPLSVPGSLILAAAALSIIAGELRLLIPLMLPPISAAASAIYRLPAVVAAVATSILTLVK